MNMKTKIEREVGGLRSDRKKVAEKVMDSYVQVEHQGQYTMVPLKEVVDKPKKEDLTKNLIAAGAGAVVGYLIGKGEKKPKEEEEGDSLFDEIEEEVRKSMEEK